MSNTGSTLDVRITRQFSEVPAVVIVFIRIGCELVVEKVTAGCIRG